MPRWLSMSIFLAIVLAISASLHGYVYSRIVSWLEPSHAVLLAIRIGVVILAVSPLATRALERVLPALYRPAWWASAVWLGVVWYLLVFLLGGQVIESGARLSQLWPGPDGLRLSVGLPTVAALLVAVYGFVRARQLPPVSDIEVAIPGLPAHAHGMTLVQISDLHIGVLIDPRRTAAIVDQLNDLEADAILITGDLVDERPDRLAAFVPVLSKLRAKHGVYAVTGNHEFYSGVRASMTLMRKAGIRVLSNESVELVPGLLLAGIHDPTALQFPYEELRADQADFPKILAGSASMPTVLMYHQPVFAESFASLGVRLMLSGHTHGGQIWPFGYLSALRYPYVKGRYQIGGMTLYVNRGTGQWGPPMRVGAPLEISRFTLRPAEPTSKIG